MSARPADCSTGLDEAGIDQTKAYLTNAVKHFNYEPRSKKRLHKRPNPGEVKRYRWWLQKELAFVRPRPDRSGLRRSVGQSCELCDLAHGAQETITLDCSN